MLYVHTFYTLQFKISVTKLEKCLQTFSWGNWKKSNKISLFYNLIIFVAESEWIWIMFFFISGENDTSGFHKCNTFIHPYLRVPCMYVYAGEANKGETGNII